MGYIRDQFNRIKCLILDEADRILDEQSTKEDVNYILDCLNNRQYQFFISATENTFLTQLRKKSHQFNVNTGENGGKGTGGQDHIKDLKGVFSLPETLKMKFILCPDELKDQYL